MYPVKLSSNIKKEIFLLESFLKKFPRNPITVLRPASIDMSIVQSERKPAALPSLPVQPLEKMLDKYLKSVKPFLSSSELEKTQELLNSFCNDSSAKKLQRLLEERAKSMDNWLSDWWLQTAYLEYRDPVIIYSSPGLVWCGKYCENTLKQLMYAAKVIEIALEFNQAIESNLIPPDRIGKDQLCMSQYKRIFGTCRVPKIPRDELLLQDPDNPSKNIIVMYNNHVFSLPAFENDKRKPYKAAQFYSMILNVIKAGSNKPGIPVGILTTEHRDNWAKSYEELKKDQRNKYILENYVEKALFVVCIDKPVAMERDLLGCDSRCSKILLHGYGSKGSAGNRWYDKTLQFVIGAEKDGMGIVYEHSPAEGGPIAFLTDYICSSPTLEEEINAASEFPEPEKLEFVISDTIKENITKAEAAVNKLSSDLDVLGWCFKIFGKRTIKDLGSSPDSFIQIAIQLAFYNLHGHPAAQYESGSLRKFKYGRTDTIRTCSEDVVSFCEMISREGDTSVEASKALRLAINSHKDYVREVSDGRGVDRHLLALKILARMNNMEDPKIFSDLAYQRSTHFQLSTSNVSAKANAFMVYGPLVHDGYACCYNPREETINFGMSAWSSCETTHLKIFKQSLEKALISMRRCLACTAKSSKL